MADTFSEAEETIEHYKVKLMEKEREVSSVQAAFKKNQLKFNRDINQLKNSEEKAKRMLKDERAKLQKSIKTAAEATEQNALLQKRFQEMRQEKEKDIQSIRTQYNNLKNEVRSYERILPTLAFMNKFNATFEQIPTYQEIFINWHQKTEKCESLEQKFKNYKTETQQKLETQQKVQQSLTKKKIQLQKHLRDDMSRVLQIQTNLSTVTMQRDYLRQKLAQTQQQLNTANQSVQQLTDETKGLHGKLEQIIKVYEIQMQTKDQELQRILDQQNRKHEEEIEKVMRDFQRKQNSHLEQLALFEEECHRLQQNNQGHHDRFVQREKQLYQQIQKFKYDIENNQVEFIKLQNKISQFKQEIKLKQLQSQQYLRKIQEYESQIQQLIQQKNLQSSAEQRKSKDGQKDDNQKNQLVTKISNLQDLINKLQQQIQHKQRQNNDLHNQIQDLKLKVNSNARASYEGFENNSFEDVNQGNLHYRKLSSAADVIELQKIQILEKPLNLQKFVEQIQLEKSRTSRDSHKTNENYENQISQLKVKILKLTSDIQSLTQKYKQSEAQLKKQRESTSMSKVQNKYLEKNQKQNQKSIQALKLELESMKKYKEKQMNKQNKQKSLAQEKNIQMKEITDKYLAQISTLKQERDQYFAMYNQAQEKADALQKDIVTRSKQIQKFIEEIAGKMKQNQILQDLLDHQRKQRTLMTAPSLDELRSQNSQEQQNFRQLYTQSGERQARIILLQREVDTLKSQIEELNEKHKQKVISLEQQMTSYIEQIISMKLKVANAEMKADQKTHLYNQLKKTMKIA